MAAALEYLLFDADNHYYETRDCFTRFIEPRHRDKAIQAVVVDGVERIVVGDKPFFFMDPKFDRTNPPGSLYDMVRNRDSGTTWADSYSADNMLPAFQHRDARLALMDEQHIETTIILPTLAVCVEAAMLDDVEQTYVNLRAFNKWLDEEWGFDHRGSHLRAAVAVAARSRRRVP